MNTNSVDFFNKNKIHPLPKSRQLILAAWGIGNPENIGQIIRMGHNVGAQKVLFYSDESKFRATKIKKTAGFSYQQMDWQFLPESSFSDQQFEDFSIVALETSEGSQNIYQTHLPDKILLLAGSESHGLPQEILSRCNLSVHIPMPGDCKSMNISHALSVAAFEWYRQKAQ